VPPVMRVVTTAAPLLVLVEEARRRRLETYYGFGMDVYESGRRSR
jgi:hypothetical protein